MQIINTSINASINSPTTGVPITLFVDKLISNYAVKEGRHYDLDIQDLPELELEEFAIKMFEQDECCMDFLLDDPKQCAALLREYMRRQSVDTAIEIAHEMRELLIKHYEKHMQRLVNQRIELH